MNAPRTDLAQLNKKLHRQAMSVNCIAATTSSLHAPTHRQHETRAGGACATVPPPVYMCSDGELEARVFDRKMMDIKMISGANRGG